MKEGRSDHRNTSETSSADLNTGTLRQEGKPLRLAGIGPSVLFLGGLFTSTVQKCEPWADWKLN